MKSSIPVNCPWAQRAPVAWPPFTFGHPLVGCCWASTYVLPFQSHAGPQQEVHCEVDEICLHFWPQFTARFRVLSTCTCQAQGYCFRRWRDRPFWWAGQCSACCCPPPRSSTRGPWLLSLRPRPDCSVPGLPTSCCKRMQLEWSHCRLRSGLLTWQLTGLTASTANSLMFCSIVVWLLSDYSSIIV